MTAKETKPVILCVVGARPNFVKMAPIMDAMSRDGCLVARLVHTGQHYDAEMNDFFFVDLGMPRPDVNLTVGSGTHAVQTADVMTRFEPILDEFRPDAVLVVGDVNSTLAASLVAAKKEVPVIHVEAGLRSYDRTMPEEINRVLTDQISDYLFTTERSAEVNLWREGISAEKIHFVGNVMIDALQRCLPHATPPEKTLAKLGQTNTSGYAVATLHRPSNVDDARTLAALLGAFAKIGGVLPIIFPLHPRTRARIDAAGLGQFLQSPAINVANPLGYLDMLGLVSGASLVLTDSGGLQEETTALGIPCFTLRANTERPVTVEQGTSILVGNSPDRLLAAFDDLRRNGGKKGNRPELWDGHAAERIVAILGEKFVS